MTEKCSKMRQVYDFRYVGMLSQGALVFQGTLAELQGMRRSCLQIGVSDPVSAALLLSGRGWSVRQANGYLVAADTNEVAAMNRTLVEAGFAVHHLAVESASLEEVFLKMTKSEVS